MRYFHGGQIKRCLYMSAIQGRSVTVSLRSIGRHVHCLISVIKYASKSHCRGERVCSDSRSGIQSIARKSGDGHSVFLVFTTRKSRMMIPGLGYYSFCVVQVPIPQMDHPQLRCLFPPPPRESFPGMPRGVSPRRL